jgi:hypothetical protein
MEETGVNHQPVASHWQTLSHNVVLSTPRHEQDSNSQQEYTSPWAGFELTTRMITRKKKFDSITPSLMQLHWLPVKYRSHFKLLLYVFKSLHDKAPTYLEELILPYTPGRSLRSENEGILQQPRDVRTKTYGERRFDRAGATLWNDLPIHLRKNSLFLFLKKV